MNTNTHVWSKLQPRVSESLDMFRYLKCELHTFQYTTRFSVILEAYLKGCGEAMLVNRTPTTILAWS